MLLQKGSGIKSWITERICLVAGLVLYSAGQKYFLVGSLLVLSPLKIQHFFHLISFKIL